MYTDFRLVKTNRKIRYPVGVVCLPCIIKLIPFIDKICYNRDNIVDRLAPLRRAKRNRFPEATTTISKAKVNELDNTRKQMFYFEQGYFL